MGAQREGFVVKVRDTATGAPVGVGFVVGDKEIVTCAHVVNVALGRQKGCAEQPPGDARVQVEFVLLGDAEGAPLRHCRIGSWDPPPADGAPGRDVAGLVLVGGDTLPVSAGAARLIDARTGLAGDTRVKAFGYPGNPPRKASGAWSTCVLRGAVGGGLVQLDAESESALRAQPGYSGSPVIITDRWGDAVVGMLALASREGAAHDAYAVPLSEVSAAWPEALGRGVLPPCPYRGLQAFSAEDALAGVFVGREREVERLRTMVRTQPLVMVTGPSGVGKSSLVAAGLQPELATEGWAVASFRPGMSPFDAVARALLELEHPRRTPSLEELEHRARALREEGFWTVASRLRLLTGRRIALIADQFEEVLSGSADRAQQLEFLERLLPPADAAQDPGVRLVATLRADFLPDLLELPDIGPRLQDRQLNVSPLDEAALIRVIVEPASVAGVTFTPGLAEAIAAEASRAAGSLPLLEFTLTELWALQHDRRLSFDSYQSLGGVSGALNQHAEKAYRLLAQHLDEPRIRRVLLSMVRARGGATSAVRVTVHRAHLGKDWYIAQLLADPEQRLVVLGSGGPDTAEIAHEALIREWARLAAWVEEDADFQQWLAVVEERATEADLLSATRLAEADRWLGERAADIPGAVADLIEFSRDEITAQQRTEQMLSASQELTAQLQQRSAELEASQRALQASNTELEHKAELLARQNRDIEIKNSEIEEARQVLEERAEQLAMSMRYKSEFLGNMSYELRSPLNSLLILAKLLADNGEGNLTPRQVEFAETIHGAGSDLLQLISDILDLSRVEAGKMDVSATRIALVQLVDYVEATFRPLTEEKGLDFSVRLSPELPATLYTDESRVLQVLRNLLSNAVKFTDAGMVRLSVEPGGAEVPDAIREQLWEAGSLHSPQDGLIAFSVSDSGIGIPAGKMRVIFEAFQQLDGTTSRKYGGTGLGLAISREVARVLGGEIHAVSEPTRGSTFTLYLPVHSLELPSHASAPPFDGAPDLAPVLAAGTTAERPAPARFAGEKVLIVDDDVRTVFALTMSLERHGLGVLYAENGQDCVELLGRHRNVAIVLMEIMIPEMDGYATMSAIRRLPQYAHLPIIALTAKALKGDREKAMSAGASEYVTKPVDPDHLLARVMHWTGMPKDA
ncbi:response regulator [Streptomyces sp. p1417]|uniref:Circadian input-output histidine kinase CikA n=1 Tax=Streptomyces typhae TaxID=2681492 RepID=A0A6L6X4E7_9ACTN|nr:response regulator [Streptomyces typhae]